MQKKSKRITKLLILSFLIVLALVSSIFAVKDSINSFSGQENPLNVTFEGAENHSYYLDVPRYVYAKNITIIVRGKILND